ncbi:MAG: hypothetical protein SFY68_08070 [Candidatus Sumerlaeia bacterium]|nr:hypothetical protein [Candidatus Sumerlaeia bacterium]
MNFLNNLIKVLPFLLATPLLTAAPLVMNYEGQFETSNGVAITEPIDLEFSFWDEPIGGERYANFVDLDEDVVPSNGGFVTTLIGDDPGNPIPRIVFQKDEVYLNIRVNGENLTPRKRMSSVGFSISASDSRSANAVSETFVVGAGSEIDEGDAVSIDPYTSFVYAGLCPEYENGVAAPLTETNYSTVGTKWLFGEKLGSIVIGSIENDQLSFTNTALYSVVQNMQNVRATYLNPSTFILSYYDPNDRVYVGKKCTVSGNTLTVDNNNLLLFGQGSIANSYGIARLSDNQIVIQYPDGENGPTVRARVSVANPFSIVDSQVISAEATWPLAFDSINTIIELENGFYQSVYSYGFAGTFILTGFSQFTSINLYSNTLAFSPGIFETVNRYERFSQDTTTINYNGYYFSDASSITTRNITESPFFSQRQFNPESIVYTSQGVYYIFGDQIEKINNLLGENYSVTNLGYFACGKPFVVGDKLIGYNRFSFALINPELQPVSRTSILGIALDSGDSNENVRIAVQGVVPGFNNLIPGNRYTSDYKGDLLQLDESRDPFLAITTDKILIDRR